MTEWPGDQCFESILWHSEGDGLSLILNEDIHHLPMLFLKKLRQVEKVAIWGMIGWKADCEVTATFPDWTPKMRLRFEFFLARCTSQYHDRFSTLLLTTGSSLVFERRESETLT
jgi:hypothetical protein